MANKNRGNIFKPFDALEGFNSEIKKKEEVKVEKPVLTQDRIEELQEVFNEITIGSNVYIKYYKNNKFIEVTGEIKKIDVVYKKITIQDKTIEVANIIDIKLKNNYFE